MDSQFPRMNLVGSISGSKLDTNVPPFRMDSINTENKVNSFSDTLLSMTKNLNEVANAPEVAMQDMLTGTNGTDIHDVITAINKAEISVSVATQITTKVIQAYEKIMNIQV